MDLKKANKKLIIKYLSAITLSFISPSVFGQIFSTAQNPLSVKWNYISSGGFKIIYPQELEKEAQRMANTLPFIYTKIGLGFKPEKNLHPTLIAEPRNGG